MVFKGASQPNAVYINLIASRPPSSSRVINDQGSAKLCVVEHFGQILCDSREESAFNLPQGTSLLARHTAQTGCVFWLMLWCEASSQQWCSAGRAAFPIERRAEAGSDKHMSERNRSCFHLCSLNVFEADVNSQCCEERASLPPVTSLAAQESAGSPPEHTGTS